MSAVPLISLLLASVYSAGHRVHISSVQLLSVPPSWLALSVMVRIQVPSASSPSKADKASVGDIENSGSMGGQERVCVFSSSRDVCISPNL